MLKTTTTSCSNASGLYTNILQNTMISAQKSWGKVISRVDQATGRTTKESWLDPSEGLEIIISKSSKPTLGYPKVPSWRVSGVLFPDIKWSGCEADHSTLSTAEINNEWTYTPTQIYFHGKQGDNFTFTFLQSEKETYTSQHNKALTQPLKGGAIQHRQNVPRVQKPPL